MSHEEILANHSNNYKSYLTIHGNSTGISALIPHREALAAMAEAVGVNKIEWVKKYEEQAWGFIQHLNNKTEQLAAKDEEIKLLNVEVDGIGSMLLSVQQDYIRCNKENTEMFVNCTKWKKLVAEKDKEHKEVVEDLQCQLSNLRGAMTIQDKEIEELKNQISDLMKHIPYYK